MSFFTRSTPVLALLLTTLPALAQPAAPAAPATRPASTQPSSSRPAVPQVSAEQRAVIDADWNSPTTVARPKNSLNPFNRDGAANPNFGKPDPGFLKRHEQFLERGKSPADLVFIGDSITDGWNNQKELWAERYGKYHPANFGIGGDRTQHVLWRIENGELDAVRPKVVVVMIGTNNIGQSADQIAAGTAAVVHAVRAKLPQTRVLLLGVFPRNKDPQSDQRKKLQQVNEILARLDDGANVKYLEIWKEFLAEDGTLTSEIMPDALHPNAKGYEIWADALGPTLDELMK